MTKTQAFNLGRDCGLNGATTENCHFSIFATEELKEAWEKGKAAGESKQGESWGDGFLGDGTETGFQR